MIAAPFIAFCFYTNSAWSVTPVGLTGAVPLLTAGGISTDASGGLKITSDSIVNAMVKTNAAIGLSKLAALTASKILQSDGSGVVSVVDTATYPSLTELAFLKGVTSALQTQINARTTSGAIVNADISAAAVIDTAKLKLLTASRILASDAGGLIVPVDTATYPSLTELSYLKGVSSAIQAQIALKGAITYIDAQDAILAAAIAAINPSVKTWTEVTGTTVLTAATIKNNVLCNTAGGSFSTTLPLASTLTDGYEITMSCVGHVSNAATIACNVSDKILNQDSAGTVATLTMAGYFKSYTLQLDKANSTWMVIRKIG